MQSPFDFYPIATIANAPSHDVKAIDTKSQIWALCFSIKVGDKHCYASG